MVSQTAQYALRAVVYLARIGGGPAVTEVIASATAVPPGYLSKVLRQLAKAGLLSVRRGIGGGFALAQPAGHITLSQVIGVVDPDPVKPAGVLPSVLEHDPAQLALQRVLDRAAAQANSSFERTTIRDLVSPGDELGGAA